MEVGVMAIAEEPPRAKAAGATTNVGGDDESVSHFMFLDP